MPRELPEPTTGSLADGRQIMLYELPGAPAPVLGTDHRDLPARLSNPVTTVRRDPQTGDGVIVAPARQDRTYKPSKQMCPLCPDPEGRSSELPVPDYRVAVFENRFASLGGSADSRIDATDNTGLRVERPGVGRCEVVCFASRHDGSFAELTPEHARLVLDVLAQRTNELLARPDVEEVYCFENRGEEIGVTLPHPHGQIYAFPFQTPRTQSVLAQARNHRAEHHTDLFEAILETEVADGVRILARTQHTTAFVPYAARWPAEVHVYPNRHVHNLTELTAAEADDYAQVYLRVLQAFDALYGAPLPYIASWHQYPDDADEGYLHAELFSIRRSADKLKYLAGVESGRDTFVTDKTPEAIAAELRAVMA